MKCSIIACGIALFGWIVVDSAAPALAGETPVTCPAITHIRFFPRKGHAQRMLRGRFTGSDDGRTTDFRTIAEIRETPPEGQWTEIRLGRPVRYRYVKYESPLNGWGNVAEIEFWSGDAKIRGEAFGTTGSRDNSGNDFTKALDGNVDTFFDGAEPHNQYVGLDLGPAVQTAAPQLQPPPGAYPTTQSVTITCSTSAATIRFTRNSGSPSRDSGEIYRGPVKVEKGTVLAVVAYAENLAASPTVIAPYRIGEGAADSKTVRTYHIGNSLTDTVDGWLVAVARSAGRSLDFHRFTIPGAPTDWLWNHPGTGFGDSRYAEAFFVLAPIDHIFTQPFAGHNRSIENEADHSGRFFELCRKHSPDVQAWLYVQWPGPQFNDAWSAGKGAAAGLNLKPASTWQEAVANHVAYTEAVADLINKTYRGKPVRIVPGGPAMARLKTAMDRGEVPGMKDFFAEMFADGIHLTPRGRYLIALVHYCCIYGQSAEGKAAALTTQLTDEQARIFQRIAWETVRDYPRAGIGARGQSPK